MSSSIDRFDCPICGASAIRETNHKSGEIVCRCFICEYNGEQTDEEIQEIREELEIWMEENKNAETLMAHYNQHLHDKREIEPKYNISYELFLKKYYFKVIRKCG